MQMIIDVPEQLVCDGFERPFTEEERDILIRAIGNGRSYNPQGDCISREAVRSKIWKERVEKDEGCNSDYIRGLKTAIGFIDNAPAVEQNWRFYYDHGYAQAKRDFERPQGKWDFYEDDSDDTGMAYYRCSVCGRLIHAEEAKLLKNYPFCPCGAAMRKGDTA